mmetsp:Transcript_11276/g.20304  ORF Transcript_11276/g.20304 Transcript_11276/m.20304 type:complete len:181 (-) Transcript_11276:310-852(-)
MCDKGPEKQKPNEGCGGTEEQFGYAWTQLDHEVVITVPMPEGTKAKALDVRFAVNTLSVGFKNAPPLFSGKLHRPVKEEDCMWSLVEGSLIITLEKMNLKSEEWWSCVIEGHQEIDLKLIKPPAKHVSELDEGAHAVIQKMMFDQHQKRMGLPTSDELQMQQAMKNMPGGIPPPPGGWPA